MPLIRCHTRTQGGQTVLTPETDRQTPTTNSINARQHHYSVDEKLLTAYTRYIVVMDETLVQSPSWKNSIISKAQCSFGPALSSSASPAEELTFTPSTGTTVLLLYFLSPASRGGTNLPLKLNGKKKKNLKLEKKKNQSSVSFTHKKKHTHYCL